MKGPSDGEIILIWAILSAACVAFWWGAAGLALGWW